MPHEERPDGITMVMLNGLTTGGVEQLLPLAKSWLDAPPVQTKSASFEARGFDRTEGAFVFARRDAGASSLDLTIQATPNSPLIHPALVIRNWNSASAKVSVNGKSLAEGAGMRTGIIHRLDGEDLIVWIPQTRTDALHILISRY